MSGRAPKYPETPDGRYFVASHVLWRKTDPRLPEEQRRAHVKALMKARLAVRNAKTALGERGPVWWDDDAPDYTRRAPKNTPYAEWWAEQETASDGS